MWVDRLLDSFMIFAENWNSPLPQHLKELSDTSLLTSENMEDGMTLSVRTRKIGGLLTTFLPSCSIM